MGSLSDMKNKALLLHHAVKIQEAISEAVEAGFVFAEPWTVGSHAFNIQIVSESGVVESETISYGD